jgi:hypothetical protein
MAAKNTAKAGKRKVRYEPITASREHTLTLTKVEYIKDRKVFVPEFEGFPKEITFKMNETKELPEDVVVELLRRGKIRSKEDLERKKQLIADKVPLSEMDSRDQSLMLFDLPYEV